MKLELPVRMDKPLYLSIIFIIAGINTLFASLGLGFYPYYIIEIVALLIVFWLLGKSGLTEKEVPIWVGTFIIIIGIIIGIIFGTLS